MNTQPQTKTNPHLAFQEFQKAFFQDTSKFANYSNYEISKHGFILLNNIAKGFPALINTIINLRGLGFSGFTSYEILRALQHKLKNPYNNRLPQYLFYKTEKPEKASKKVVIKSVKGDMVYTDFAPDIKQEICSRLMIDSKDYEYLKFSDRIQRYGKQIMGDCIETIKQGTIKSTTPKNPKPPKSASK
jgi:hypothetical protein